MFNIVSPRTHEEMHNRPTAYEMAISVNGKQTIVAYQNRVTEMAIRSLMQDVMSAEFEAKMMDAMTSEELNGNYTYDRERGRIIFGKNVWVGRTGRTEREAASLLLRKVA